MTTHSERLKRAAKQAHDSYELLAESYGYETREESRVEWDDLPENHKALMAASIADAIAAYFGDDGPLLAINRMRLAGYIHSDKALFLQTLQDLQDAGVIVRLGGGDS